LYFSRNESQQKLFGQDPDQARLAQSSELRKRLARGPKWAFGTPACRFSRQGAWSVEMSAIVDAHSEPIHQLAS
jgi:hypothetical protein